MSGGGIDKEIVVNGLREGVHTVVHLHLICVLCLTEVIYSETEQRVVSHLPEQAFVVKGLHTLLGKHRLQIAHLHHITVKGNRRSARHLSPVQVGVLLYVVKVGNVGDVVGIVQFKALCVSRNHSPQQQESCKCPSLHILSVFIILSTCQYHQTSCRAPDPARSLFLSLSYSPIE